jgi:hypothetical protein
MSVGVQLVRNRGQETHMTQPLPKVEPARTSKQKLEDDKRRHALDTLQLVTGVGFVAFTNGEFQPDTVCFVEQSKLETWSRRDAHPLQICANLSITAH